MGADVRGRVGRDDRAEGHRAGGRPAGSRACARGGWKRPRGAGAVRLAHLRGRGRADPAHRTGVHAAERSDLPAPRHDLRFQARRRGDPHGSHRRGVRPQPEKLRPPVHFSRPAARAHLRGRLEGNHGSVGAGHKRRFALGRSLARPAGGIRHTRPGRGDGRHTRGHGHRDVRGIRRPAHGAVDGGTGPRDGDFRPEALPRCRHRGAGARGTDRRTARGARFPDRGIEKRGGRHAPANAPERRARRRGTVGDGDRQRGGAASLHRDPRRSADRGRLPRHRAAGRNVGTAASHRVRMPLRGRLPDGGPAHAHPCGGQFLPRLPWGIRVASELGAAVRHPAPNRAGGSRRAHGCGRADAGRGCGGLAGRPGRDPGRGGGRGGHVRVSFHVRAVPRRRARLWRRARHVARLLGAARGPGSRHRRGARGFHRESFTGLNAGGHAPVRDTGRPSGPHLRPGGHGPLFGLCPGRRGLHGGGRRHRDRRRRGGDQPTARRGREAVGIAGLEPRESRRPVPDAGGELLRGGRNGTHRRGH